MPLSRRYTPEKDPAESCNYGMDYSYILPPGIGLSSGSLTIWTNVAVPVQDTTAWTIGPVAVRGRAIYARLGGGTAGTDYQLRWVAVDTQGNTWPRTALQLVALTS